MPTVSVSAALLFEMPQPAERSCCADAADGGCYDNDDGSFPHVYLEEVRTGRSIFYNDPVLGLTPELQAGR